MSPKRTKSKPFVQEVADTSGLRDEDWTEIKKLTDAYETGGQKALSKAMDELATDEIRCLRIMSAFFPDIVREKIKDEMAVRGITEEDLREMIRKLESPSIKNH
jgi:hypothetical protein